MCKSGCARASRSPRSPTRWETGSYLQESLSPLHRYLKLLQGRPLRAGQPLALGPEDAARAPRPGAAPAGQARARRARRQFWIPPGFAHGFCVLSETAEVEYKCTEIYLRDDEIAIAWDDPEIGIAWPVA